MSPLELIPKLKQLPGVNFRSVEHVTYFLCDRDTKHGRYQRVTVEIHDAGPDAPAGLRYTCVAKSDDGKAATGNPNASIDVVLATVHWGDLDG